jgi:hypothetical protein
VGPDSFNGPVSASGSTSLTFRHPGTYTYYCTIHGYNVMHAVVAVQSTNPGALPGQSGAPAPGSAPGTGTAPHNQAGSSGATPRLPGAAQGSSVTATAAASPPVSASASAAPSDSPTDSPSDSPSFDDSATSPSPSSTPGAFIASTPSHKNGGNSAAPFIAAGGLAALVTAGTAWFFWIRRLV